MSLPWSGTVTEWLRSRLLADVEPPDVEELMETNWCPLFINLMHDRFRMGIWRYRRGHMHDPDAVRYDNVGSAIRRLEKYLSDGNLEHLVDVANLCVLEFVKGPKGVGSQRSPKWCATDDGDHAKEIR